MTYTDLNALLENAEKNGHTTPFSAENKNGEAVIIQRAKDCIILQTFQHNGWVRTNEYYPDGTITETYDK